MSLADALVAAGRDREAEKLYRDLLRLQPDRTEIRIRLAAALARLGRAGESERLLMKLLGQPVLEKPEIRELVASVLATAWCGAKEAQAAAGLRRLQKAAPEPDILVCVAEAFGAKGQTGLAAEACNLALDRWPQHAGAFARLGAILLASGDGEGAILAGEKAVTLDMSRIDARMTLALGLIRLSRYQEAEQVFQDALLLDSESAEVLGNYANFLHGLGRNAEARHLLNRAIEHHPGIANLYSLLGLVLMRMGKFDEALASLDRAISLDPASDRFASAKADCLLELDRIEEACALLSAVIDRDPNHAPALCSLARIDIERGDLERADSLLERALALDPDRVHSWNNLGVLRKRQFRHAEALAAFEEAGRCAPLSPGTLYNKAFALLGVGQLAEGWDHYEVGVHANLRNGWRMTFKPIWDGESLAGKSLGIVAEQGIGDQIMFLSCLEDFAKGPGSEAKLSLEVHPKIRDLIARSFLDVDVCDALQTPQKSSAEAFEGDFDYVMYLGSLPAVVRRSHKDFTGTGGFLKADPARVEHWRERLAALGPEPVIGLCWRSMLLHTGRNHWYLQLEDLEPIFTLPGARFVSLQYGDARTELAEAERRWPGRILSLEDELDLTDDLDEVAALNTALTAVVAPNTTCSVLSAGIGCPTYEFTVGPAWNMLGTDHVPFFPSQKVFDYPFGTPLVQAIPMIRAALQRDLGLSQASVI
ncbi:tetratricopeptide repeat protein [Algihabitans albus]|uniref:tetratricopeptide repeat protein n=1 Tax=Algihabitans albus TaxID=2164067 RepID=UPI0013C2AEA9|nr:tetratricopeptide repeat protein [Algihabitans albus]